MTVRLWDAVAGKPIGELLEGHTDMVWSVSFSPDGSRIVTGSEDKTIRLWDVATGQPVGQPLRGHNAGVNSVFVSRDETRIISSSWDGSVRVWYAVIGKSLQKHAEEDCSAFPPHSSCIPDPTAAIPTSNTANDAFISYSSNPTYSLRDTAELLTGTSYDDHTFVLREDGWIMGPNRRLLFWVPPASQKALRYNPRTTFAIPRGVELDLSRMAHGTRWQDCYKE
ncbi:WD40-repeat-containing domain protein [Suillus tomentosus]|nr:WD40-repeat-containing domain protein [Suillus tomentosus]